MDSARHSAAEPDPSMLVKSKPITPLWGYAVIVTATVLTSIAGGLVSGGESDPWYAALNKSDLNPPGVAFAVVWPVLFILMAVSACLVWRAGGARTLPLYLTQLVVNFAWSATFFGAHLILPALAILAALWGLIAVMIASYRRYSRPAAALLLPYLLWVSFAGYLNVYVALAN